MKLRVRLSDRITTASRGAKASRFTAGSPVWENRFRNAPTSSIALRERIFQITSQTGSPTPETLKPRALTKPQQQSAFDFANLAAAAHCRSAGPNCTGPHGFFETQMKYSGNNSIAYVQI